MRMISKVTILITLFRKKPLESLSYVSLMDAVHNLQVPCEIVVYNNSQDVKVEEIPGVVIINVDIDGKLPDAYNYGLKLARTNGSDWLLLLDQDTEITKEYFLELNGFLLLDKFHVDAIVPLLVDMECVLSPKLRSRYGYWENAISRLGMQDDMIVAFNSMSLLRIDFLVSIGGFTDRYQLDFLDHWYYLQLYKTKRKVYVMNCKINHSLSFQTYEKEVSLERHKNFLNAECTFVTELGHIYYISYKIKLFLRVFKQMILFTNKNYALLSATKFLCGNKKLI